jgi:hypothetical protein
VGHDVVADGAEDRPDESTMHIGKVATATFFAKSVLPLLAAQTRIVDTVDLTVMEMPEEAF